MPKTVVGLFENAQLVDAAVLEIEALGFPRQEVRTVREPANFDVTGVMSFPRLDLEVDLNRELTRIGATGPEARAYVEGLRRRKCYEPARRGGSRKGHWSRAAATWRSSQKHDADSRGRGHGRAHSPARRRRLFFRMVMQAS